MTNTAILAVSALLVLAYLLDVIGRQLRLPSVVLLIGTGIAGRLVLDRLGIQLQFVEDYVPLLGTLGLILIVLEGALDLDVHRDRLGLVLRSSISALLGFWLCLFALLFAFARLLDLPLAIAALVAIPFAFVGAKAIDPSAAEGTLGFKLLIIPGAMVFWPLMLRRWMRKLPPPVECSAHRRNAK